MKTLDFAPDLALPIDAVTQRFAFLGRIGTGKTYALTKLVELMLDAGAQVVALDPVGKFYGLRVPGTGPGYRITVFGGLHGDIPLEPTAGALIADLIVDRGLSCVLDVSQFATDADKARFAAAFADRFFMRKKAQANPTAVFLAVEECQEFFAENPMKGDRVMSHYWIRMAKLGRNFGIGLGLASQRPQEVSKKVLNLTEVMVAFQLRGKHERAAVRDWVTDKDADTTILDELPKLPIGVAWIDSPQWLGISRRVKANAKRSADVSATPTVGAARVDAKPLTDVDLGTLRDAMAATIEKAKADDPRELRKRIAELERAAKSAPAKTVEKPVVDERAAKKEFEKQLATKWIHGHQTGVISTQEWMRKKLAPIDAHLQRFVDSLRSLIAEIETNRAGAQAELDAEARSNRVAHLGAMRGGTKGTPARGDEFGIADSTRLAPLRPQATVQRSVPRSTNGHASADGVSGLEQRILNTLAGMEALGVAQPDKATVATLVGYHPNAKSYANATGSLRTAGRIAYPAGGRISLTDDGRAIAENSLPVSSIAELHALWFERLGNVARKILEPLLAAHPDAVAVADVADSAGYHPNAKSFANMKGRLRTLGLIDYPSSGQMVATDVLFPEGL